MANIKKSQARISQPLEGDNPVGTNKKRSRTLSRNKIQKSPAASKHEVSTTPRMALVKIEPMMSQEMIAVAAYYKAEKRGFIPGGEVEDWLEAENEIRGPSRLM